MSTHWSWDTEQNADTVEWCPVEGLYDILAVGTYQVDKDASSETFSASQRRGKLHVLRLDCDQCVRLFSRDFRSVLDMRWMLQNDEPALATVDADGRLTLHQWSSNDNDLKSIAEHKLIHNGDEDVLALSLDICRSRILVSDSKGFVHANVINEGRIVSECSIKAHSFEAWITCASIWDENVIFSGGDDAKLKVFDLRNPLTPVKVCKEHDAGVTSLSCVKDKTNEILSGSYDENLCHWDLRSMKEPLGKLQLGGGVWRIKQNPNSPDLFALACMYNGFKIFSLAEFREVMHYEKHESIAYGIDWNKDKSKQHLLASCSFYDNLLTLWNIHRT